MLFTIDPDGTVRPPQYTEFRIVTPPFRDTVFLVNGERRWYQPSQGAEPVPFYGPYVADWLDWLEEQGAITWFG